MKFSKELIEKAKTAKTAEELLAMAKAENIELTEEQAAKAFAELSKNGVLSDEELDNVAGGGCGDTPDRSYVRRKACRWDADGNATHWYALDYATERIDVIVYFTCPKCGGMLHEGFGYKLFCDPCDTSYNDYFDNVDVHKIY